MPDELTPEEQDILANSPADAPVIVGDAPEEQPADDEVMGTAAGPSTVPDATEADPEPDAPS
jgi:hypothetical protein